MIRVGGVAILGWAVGIVGITSRMRIPVVWVVWSGVEASGARAAGIPRRGLGRRRRWTRADGAVDVAVGSGGAAGKVDGGAGAGAVGGPEGQVAGSGGALGSGGASGRGLGRGAYFGRFYPW